MILDAQNVRRPENYHCLWMIGTKLSDVANVVQFAIV